MSTDSRILQAKAFIAEKFGYDIQDLGLVMKALNATGPLKKAPLENNCLAVLGDSALDLAMASSWYPTGTSAGK